jgi:8-oxo-dGTP diphosphatase
MNDRLFPTRPILAVSAAVFREGRVLIVRRARALLLGHFSLPGGGVEIGETNGRGARPELTEEVGVEAEIIAFNRHVEAIIPEGDRVRGHFVISSFGEPRLSEEVDAVDWIDPAASLRSPTTPELGDILARAALIESRLWGAEMSGEASAALRAHQDRRSAARYPVHGVNVKVNSSQVTDVKKLSTRRSR